MEKTAQGHIVIKEASCPEIEDSDIKIQNATAQINDVFNCV